MRVQQFTSADKLDRELFGEDDTSMATVESPIHRMQIWFTKQLKHQPGADYVGFKVPRDTSTRERTWHI